MKRKTNIETPFLRVVLGAMTALLSAFWLPPIHANAPLNSCLNGGYEDVVKFGDNNPVRFKFSERCLSKNRYLKSNPKNKKIELTAYWPGFIVNRPNSKESEYLPVKISLSFHPRPDIPSSFSPIMFSLAYKGNPGHTMDLVKTEGDFEYYYRSKDKKDGKYQEGDAYIIKHTDRADFMAFCVRQTCSVQGIVDEIVYRARINRVGIAPSSDWLSVHNDIAQFINSMRANALDAGN